MAERTALKDRVLEAALLHAAFDGWSRRTLHNAALDAGSTPPTARRLFPRGGDSLLAWLDDWADRRMLAAVAASISSGCPSGDASPCSCDRAWSRCRLIARPFGARRPHAVCRGISPGPASRYGGPST